MIRLSESEKDQVINDRLAEGSNLDLDPRGQRLQRPDNLQTSLVIHPPRFAMCFSLMITQSSARGRARWEQKHSKVLSEFRFSGWKA